MLDIRRIFNEICDDCIGIILDYIEPIDILKLIYYNKHYLYLSEKCNEKRKITVDSTQLLMYEKFYKKVLKNLEIYVGKHNAKLDKIEDLLDENTARINIINRHTIYNVLLETILQNS